MSDHTAYFRLKAKNDRLREQKERLPKRVRDTAEDALASYRTGRGVEIVEYRRNLRPVLAETEDAA